jgi:O-methyltransferase
MFCGTLAEVRQNIARFGAPAVCDFVPGFFADSLPQVTQPVAFAFLDVDLPASFQDCLRSLWPRLVEGGLIYVDDVGCMDLVQIFFDDGWWQQEIGCKAPGLVGSGCGLPLHPVYSNIGYTRKASPVDATRWQPAPDLAYPTREHKTSKREEPR